MNSIQYIIVAFVYCIGMTILKQGGKSIASDCNPVAVKSRSKIEFSKRESPNKLF